MPAVNTYPLLRQNAIAQNSANVAAAFPDKAPKLPKRLQEEIALLFADAASAKASPSLLATVKSGHGFTHAIKVRGAVLVVDEHVEGNKRCLKLFAPMAPGDFKLKKLQEGGVEALYDVKSWQKIDRIVIDIFPRAVDVYLNGDREQALEGAWSHALGESALAVLGRAQFQAQRESDATQGSANSSSTGKRSIAGVLASAKTKVTAGPPLGDDLEAALSWRGQPLVVTSDRSGKESVHVMVERRDPRTGEGTWWPIPVPDHQGFAKRGCSVFLDGDTLHITGGVDGDGDISAARFSVDLNAALRPGFSADQWKERAPLKDATAWATAALNDREALVVGGVAGFFVGQNGKKASRPLVNTQLGGMPNWRERSAPPASTVGSHTLVDTSNGSGNGSGNGCAFVGPGKACDGNVSLWDQRESAWFSLPRLPLDVGLGQLHKSGDELVYSGGFDANGKASKKIFAIDLKDPMGTWQDRGESDAVSGKARVVERDGKLVSLLVAPKGALLVHLE
jgi:hypothetical protein